MDVAAVFVISEMAHLSYKNWIYAFMILGEDKNICLGVW